MRRPYFVFSNGRLVRHQNTVYLHTYDGERGDSDEDSLEDAASQAGCTLEELEESMGAGQASTPGVSATAWDDIVAEWSSPARAVAAKKPLPVEDVDSLYVFGEMEFNTKFFNFAARHHVPIHFFNWFGFYTGSFMPRGEVHSGSLLVAQVTHYSDKKKRVEIARAFVDGASFNILKNLRYYGSASRGRDLSFHIAQIEGERAKLPDATDVNTVMGLEGRIRKLYYEAWPLILSAEWAEFTTRIKRPPDNPVNALISFGNTLCYTLALSELYRTPLDPKIAFLHEPSARRFSLSLDIAEIFKPILVDRMLFKLINNGEIRPQHFEEKLNFCYLKENGRKIVTQAWDERLKTTIEHRNLGRHVSYRRLVRLECYALARHVLGAQAYQPFKTWW